MPHTTNLHNDRRRTENRPTAERSSLPSEVICRRCDALLDELRGAVGAARSAKWDLCVPCLREVGELD
jgi:hypothetical protein